MLDALVQLVFHPSSARVRQDAAVAEGAGPKFGAALQPPEHLPFGQEFCRLRADVLAAPARCLEANQHFVGSGPHHLIFVFDAGVGMIHDI